MESGKARAEKMKWKHMGSKKSNGRNVLVSAIIAAIIGVALVSAIFLVPGLPRNGQSSSSSSSSSSQTTSQSGSQQGFSVLMTDPPNVPNGTTNLYMTYNKVGLHVKGDGNQSKYWDIITQTGTIDLMRSVNLSQTLGISTVLPQGRDYNAVGFNISRVTVTYNGQNYTADIVYDQNKLYIPIPGGVSVVRGTGQAIMIDMTPKVLMFGSATKPTFAFVPSAIAFVIPSSNIPAQAFTIGAWTHLAGYSWWQSFVKKSAFSITAVSLSPNSLQLNVSNTGNTSFLFRMATITAGNSTDGYTPLLSNSAVFLVEPNGTLVLASGSNKTAFYQELEADGYLVAPHTTMTFTFTGKIQTGLLQFGSNPSPPQTIKHGSFYVVRLIAADRMAVAATQSA